MSVSYIQQKYYALLSFHFLKTKFMKKINYGFATIGLMLLIACSKVPDVSCDSPTNDAALSRKLILGTWRLHRIQTALDTTATWYPPKKGMIDVKFKEDGTLEYYVDNKLVNSTKYDIDIMKKYTLYYADTTRNVLSIDKQGMTGLESLVPIRICSDSLYLRYESFRYHGVGDCFYYRK